MTNTQSNTTAKTHPETEIEFGGAVGAFFIIILSHFLLYYLWTSINYYQGGLPLPTSVEDIFPFCGRFFRQIIEHATPTLYALKIYAGFILFQLFLAYVMPGSWVKGLPVPSENNRQYQYLCNGITSWYVTLFTALILHYTGLFRLTQLVDNLGPLMSVAMLSADMIAIIVYAIVMLRQKKISMSGNMLYDFFIGVILNPRINRIDLKFFSEVRVAWILLFLLTLSAALKQYDLYKTISWPMIFMLVAHGLYTNACMKGEECIPTTWDIFHEKWGWMLIFWNFAGVPFFYSFQSFYILENNPQFSNTYILLLFILLLSAYYVWDTSQSQKNRFRMQCRGTYVTSKAFPQLPWGTLKNPQYLLSENGDKLLIDGWWRYARKIHYTADIIMALTWALSCGFGGMLPYLYPLFFLLMITHRYQRDTRRCIKKYGIDWENYKKAVPYKFIPYIY